MKVFVVAQPKSGITTDALIKLIGCIKTGDSKNVPIVVVDQLYNLADLAVARNTEEQPSTEMNSLFELDQFLDHRQIGSPLEPHLMASHLNSVISDWVTVDFGLHSAGSCMALISQLGRFCHSSSNLIGRNLVLLVPPIQTGYFARIANESFNCLAISPIELDRSGQTSMLILSSSLERVLLSVPMFTGTMRRINRLLLNLYQRMARPS